MAQGSQMGQSGTSGQMAPMAKPDQMAMPMPMMAPAVGAKAPAFNLKSIDGKTVSLAAEVKQATVVLIVGRGWPGYQCPFCTRQFADFRTHAAEFEKAGAHVVWIYPGPAEGLTDHAHEFVAGKDVPANFRVLVDPAYTFTNAYGLRWDAQGETAYPATFVIDHTGVIRLADVSHEHDGRSHATDIVASVQKLGSSMMKK
jgi:peroxiredoxin